MKLSPQRRRLFLFASAGVAVVAIFLYTRRHGAATPAAATTDTSGSSDTGSRFVVPDPSTPDPDTTPPRVCPVGWELIGEQCIPPPSPDIGPGDPVAPPPEPPAPPEPPPRPSAPPPSPDVAPPYSKGWIDTHRHIGRPDPSPPEAPVHPRLHWSPPAKVPEPAPLPRPHVGVTSGTPDHNSTHGVPAPVVQPPSPAKRHVGVVHVPTPHAPKRPHRGRSIAA